MQIADKYTLYELSRAQELGSNVNCLGGLIHSLTAGSMGYAR
jgi:hypothetical protein